MIHHQWWTHKRFFLIEGTRSGLWMSKPAIWVDRAVTWVTGFLPRKKQVARWCGPDQNRGVLFGDRKWLLQCGKMTYPAAGGGTDSYRFLERAESGAGKPDQMGRPNIWAKSGRDRPGANRVKVMVLFMGCAVAS